MRNVLALLLVAVPLAAQPARIRVPVWTEPGARVANFTVKVDGQDARVLATRGPADDLMIILVLDFTGDVSLVETAKQAAVAAIEQLPAKTAVAVLRAQDGMQVVLDPTSDRQAAAQAIRQLPATGKAGFLETVEDACRIGDRLLSRTQVRAAVLYLTDSSIYNYRQDYTNPVINSSDSRDLSRRFPEGLVKEKLSRLTSAVTALQAPLFIVHLAYRTDRLEQTYQAGLLQLASATGGAGVFNRSSAEIPASVAAAFRNAVSHYSLDVQLPESHGRVVEVHVESAAGPVTYRSRFAR